MSRRGLRLGVKGVAALSAFALLALAGVLFASSLQAAAPMSSTTRPKGGERPDPCALPPPERGRLLLISEAVRLGLVEVAFRGTDSTTSLDLTVKNNSDEPVTVEVPPGTPVEPGDDAVQRMLTGTNEPVTVGPGQSVTRRIAAYCTENFKKAPPSDGSVAMTQGDRTPETEQLTAIIEAAEYLRRLDGEFSREPPGPMERANPERFWASVALWSLYRTTDEIGPKEFKQVMLEQLSGRTTREKAASTAERVTEETFEKVEEVYSLISVTRDEPLDRDLIRTSGKWCGQDQEDGGTILIKDTTQEVPAIPATCPDCDPYTYLCLNIFVVGKKAEASDKDLTLGIPKTNVPSEGPQKGLEMWESEPPKLPPGKFGKDGLADLGGIKGDKALDGLKSLINDVIGQGMNQLYKWCCIRFEIAGLYGIDPSKAKVDGKTLKDKYMKESPGEDGEIKTQTTDIEEPVKIGDKVAKDSQGNPITKSALMEDLGKLAKDALKGKGKKCLNVFLVPGYKWPPDPNRKGIAGIPGTTSVLDENEALKRTKPGPTEWPYYDGRLIGHEVGHNLGFEHGEEKPGEYDEPKGSTGGRKHKNLMTDSPGKDGQYHFVLDPDKQCKKAKAHIAKEGLSETDLKKAKEKGNKLWEEIEKLHKEAEKEKKAKEAGGAKEAKAEPEKKLDPADEMKELKKKLPKLQSRARSKRAMAKGYRDNGLEEKAKKYDKEAEDAENEIKGVKKRMKELKAEMDGDKDGKKGAAPGGDGKGKPAPKTKAQELNEKLKEWNEICCDRTGMSY